MPATLIVGAGVSGLSVAWRLLQRGERVTLLERGDAGGESSWAGGGILSPLLPWDYPDTVTALALRAMAGFPGWLEEIEAAGGGDAEFWRCGMLALDTTDRDAALAWCEAHRLAAMAGLPAGRSGVPQRPAGAVWLPEIAQARNPRLVAALRAAVLARGGTLVEQCAARGVLTAGTRVTAVQTAAGTFAAERVVLAAGAWSGAGLEGLAGVPQVRPIRGQMLLFKLEPGTLDTILYRDGLYLIPRRDGHLLVGSTVEDAGFDKTTDAATAVRLQAAAAELLPVLATRQPVRHWAGLRPGAPANLPVIDRHPDFDNVYVNAGHYRYGVTMAPAAAELLVDLIDGTVPALDPAPYRWQAARARHWQGTR